MIFRKHADNRAVGAVGKTQRDGKENEGPADAGTAEQGAIFLTEDVTEGDFQGQYYLVPSSQLTEGKQVIRQIRVELEGQIADDGASVLPQCSHFHHRRNVAIVHLAEPPELHLPLFHSTFVEIDLTYRHQIVPTDGNDDLTPDGNRLFMGNQLDFII